MHEFSRTLSNTAPVYLESMKKIILSIDEIDASSDIESFVSSQTQLTEKLVPPVFEQHQAATVTPPARDEVGIPILLCNGDKQTHTGSLKHSLTHRD